MAQEEPPPLVDVWARVRRLAVYARARRDGDGPAIVLVHGLAVSSRYMIPLARALAPSFRVYAPDLPGWGKSERPTRALGVVELAEVLAEWMGAIGLESAVLLGNSMGCQVVADVASRHPARVERAVFVGPTVDAHARSLTRHAGRLFLDALAEPPSLWAVAGFDYAVFGPRRLLATSRHALADRIEDKLPHVRAPTLVVRGERDRIVPQRWAEEVARLLPDARLAVVPDRAHAVNYNAPDELARLVRDFVQER